MSRERTAPAWLTEAYIDSRINGVAYTCLDGTETVLCHVSLDTGYSVRGEACFADPGRFDRALGEQLAYQDARRKLWEVFIFLAFEQRHAPRPPP